MANYIERRPGRGGGRNAFTLVEMLVVVAIILILVGALIPALEKAQYHAIRSKCVSQHRQQFLAITCYANDFGGLYPGGRFPNTVSNGPPGTPALLYNGGYLKIVDMFYDPGAKEYWNWASPARFMSVVPTENFGECYCDYSFHCGWSYWTFEKLDEQRKDSPGLIACTASKRWVSTHWWLPGGGPQPHLIKNKVGGVNTTFYDGRTIWITENLMPTIWNKPWANCDAIWNQYHYGSFWHWIKTDFFK